MLFFFSAPAIFSGSFRVRLSGFDKVSVFLFCAINSLCAPAISRCRETKITVTSVN